LKLGDKITLGFKCRVDEKMYQCQFDTRSNSSDVKECTITCNMGEGIQIVSQIYCEADYGLVKRSDCIVNRGDNTVVLREPASTISAPSDGLLYGFKSEWCHEFTPVSVTQLSAKNRTCFGAQPYFALTDNKSSATIINLLPIGDWRVRLEEAKGIYTAVIDFNDDLFSLTLEPGDEFNFAPEYLVSSEDQANPYPSGDKIQEYAAEQMRTDELNRPLPVIYNTWFDHFHKISVEGMLKQAQAAKEVGCEVFVIDAGWFGPGVRHWTYVGDWRVNPSVFREVSLKEFSDKIREMGMQFGIWMEPERIHADCPVRLANPDWFIQTPGSEYYYPDLAIAEAYEWVYSEVSCVLAEYDVKWIKIDCNGAFSDDPYKTGHRIRMERFYELMDKLIVNFPETVFEACASGGLRADLNTLAHYHTHFQSDTVDPIDTINLGLSALTRLKPGMESKWAVMYPASGFTPYENEPLDTGDYVLSPTLATSYKLSTFDLSFVMRASMPGTLGLGGNIADLSPTLKQKLAGHVAFYKNNRDFIQTAVGIPLTGAVSSDETSMRAMQLINPDHSRSLVFVYNIGLQPVDAVIRPVMLEFDSEYSVKNVDTEITETVSGKRLMEEGLGQIPVNGQQALVFEIQRL